MNDGFVEIHVSPEQGGWRLDQILALRVSRRFARKLIDNGAVFVNNTRVKVASRKVPVGAVVRAPLSLPQPVAMDARQWIVHEQEDFVIADKPPGLPTAPTLQGDLSLVTHLQAFTGPLWIVSRLDHHTSGLVPFVRNAAILKPFEELLRSDACHKVYVALTPRVPLAKGLVEFPIGPDPRRPRRFRVDAKGKPACTEILRVQPVDDTRQCVWLRLWTGRTHQIRVHLAHLGAPVTGDPWYPENIPSQRMYLHAYGLSWTSDIFGNVSFFRDPPGDFSVPP